MSFVKRAALALCAAFISTSASAAIVSFDATVQQIAAPAAVSNGTPGSNTHILAFDELQGYTLGSALNIDGGGTIAAGTVVDSHMVFLNRASGGGILTVDGNITFSGSVLGTISDFDGILMGQSDYLGGTIDYSAFGANFAARGLELTGFGHDDEANISGNSVFFNLGVTQPGDWVRVVTAPAAVPLPASMAFLGAGIAGLGLMRRRKRA